MYICEGCKREVDYARTDLMVGGAELCDYCMDQEMENVFDMLRERNEQEAWTPYDFVE